MRDRQEGSFERNFWVVVGYITFGSIAVPLGLGILDAFLGNGRGNIFHDMAPVFLFGMAMVGMIGFGSALVDLLKGKAEWVWLAVSGAWLFFFGRAFLRAAGTLL